MAALPRTIQREVPLEVLELLNTIHKMDLQEGTFLLDTQASRTEVIAVRCFKCGMSLKPGQFVDTGCYYNLLERDTYLETRQRYNLVVGKMQSTTQSYEKDMEKLQQLRDTARSPHSPRSQTQSPRGHLDLPPRPQTSYGGRRNRTTSPAPSLAGRYTPIAKYHIPQSQSMSSLA